MRYSPSFWIGPSRKKLILVSIPSGLDPVSPANITRHVEKGDIVDVTGTVRPAPDDTQLKAVYGLDNNGIAQVRQLGIIVEAGAVIVRTNSSGR